MAALLVAGRQVQLCGTAGEKFKENWFSLAFDGKRDGSRAAPMPAENPRGQPFLPGGARSFSGFFCGKVSFCTKPPFLTAPGFPWRLEAMERQLRAAGGTRGGGSGRPCSSTTPSPSCSAERGIHAGVSALLNWLNYGKTPES